MFWERLDAGSVVKSVRTCIVFRERFNASQPSTLNPQPFPSIVSQSQIEFGQAAADFVERGHSEVL
jgi:hypothetical protein